MKQEKARICGLFLVSCGTEYGYTKGRPDWSQRLGKGLWND